MLAKRTPGRITATDAPRDSAKSAAPSAAASVAGITVTRASSARALIGSDPITSPRIPGRRSPVVCWRRRWPMSEPRAPRESLAEMLHVERRRDGRHVATLESFWGAAAPGDLVARAVLATGATQAPSASHAVFLREAAPDVELGFACEPLGP